jgi:DNA gyrase/topoisomerase IV subunit B
MTSKVKKNVIKSLDPREHCLTRPDMYIGSIKNINSDFYGAVRGENGEYKIQANEGLINPGLHRIFIEIISNAIDNVWRSLDSDTPSTKIKIEITQQGQITVWNDGLTIPVEIDKDSGLYMPELAFGRLMSGSNFNDNEERKTSGRNGIGSTCQVKGSMVPLWNGKQKKVEDIVIGDILIGDDGNKRKVLSLTQGEDEMYKVSHPNGYSYFVSSNHILSLRRAGDREIYWNDDKGSWIMVWTEYMFTTKVIEMYVSERFTPEGYETNESLSAYFRLLEFDKTTPYNNTFDIKLKDYIGLPEFLKSKFTGFLGDCVQWEHKDILIDPYVLGLWLGDGKFNSDPYMEYWDTTTISNNNKWEKLLQHYNLVDNIHIPKDFLINSEEVRLNLLAGLLDASSNGDMINICQYTHEVLFKDILFLLKFLGIKYSIDSGFVRFTVFSQIPTRDRPGKRVFPIRDRIDSNLGMITVEKVENPEKGEYFGFTLDGNGRYVTEDYIVTHNCTNIYSKEFIVRTYDVHNGKKYIQKWTNNMSIKEEPKISSVKLKNGYTEISFLPDYKRFGVDGLGTNMLELFTKNIIDIAMITGISVFLNDEKIPIKTLKDYAQLYEDTNMVSIQTPECSVILAANNSGSFKQSSFVNGVETYEGGCHVDAWIEALLRPVLEKINKGKGKDLAIKDIKPYFRLFLNCKLINPSFTSQEKTKLSGPTVKTEVLSKHIVAIMKWDIIKEIKNLIEAKDLSALKKTEKKRGFRKIEGLDPANLAGSKNGHKCSLIICEGLSAATFAISGITTGVYGQKGRDYLGVFAAKGKVLNPRGKTGDVISKNKEIASIIQSLNLKIDTDYTNDSNYKTLSYGRVIILTDGDVDGCLEANTLVNLSSGVSMKIKDTIDVESCLAWRSQEQDKNKMEGLIPVKKTKYMDKGMKKCVELLFEDGRNIILTPDHRLCSMNGDWIEAKDALNKTFKMTGIYPELDYNQIDPQWSLKAGTMTFKTDSKKEIDRTMAFMRVLGLLLGKCRGELYLGNIIDVNSVLKDLELFLDNSVYTVKEFTDEGNVISWRIYLKMSFVCSLEGILNQSGSLPIFLNNCPLILIREFLGGLFGGDGVAPCLTRVSKEKVYHFSGLGFVKSKTEEHLQTMIQIQNLLKLFNVNSTISKPVNRTRDKMIKLLISTDSYLDFANFVGFRHCSHKLQRLSCVQSYYLLYEKVRKQRKDMVELGLKFRKLSFSIPIALQKAIEQYSSENIIIHEASYPIEGNLKDSKQNKILCRSGFDNVVTFLKKIDGLKYFNNRQGNDQLTDSLSVMNLKVISIREVQELQHVYDLTIEDPYHSFISNGIVAHNCHIGGLLINMFHYLFPSLMNRKPAFLTAMRTPIIRIYYMRSKTVEFYTIRDFEKYHKEHKDKGGEIKYFKGLGTNTKKEALEIFGKKMIEFSFDSNAEENINKVFDPKQTDIRKKWLEEYDPLKIQEIVSNEQYQQLSVSDYLNNEMILYSIDSCKRALPNIMDGLKESQRKVIYAAELKNLNYSGKTLKVAQLAAFVAEKTAYHHGENCLLDTITKMAQDFIGSNNIPLLYRGGQFGSRLEPCGSDAASGRYIFTKFDKLTRLIYKPEDDDLLTHIIEEDQKIEPEFFVPILPMILINGCTAIATGFSTNIPAYNPLDILTCVRAYITQSIDYRSSTSENIKFSIFPEIVPWYNGFLGSISKIGKNKYLTTGVLNRNSSKKVSITELPIGMATSKFKDFLDNLLESKQIKSYKNYSSDTLVNFEIEEDDFECTVETLKLTSSLSTSNMVLFNERGIIKKYEDIDDILEDFCRVRYEYYVRRKANILKNLLYEIKIRKNKINFLKDVMSDKLDIKNVDENKLLNDMIKMKYDPISSHESEDESNSTLKKFQYLIGMNIRSFTLQKMKILQDEYDHFTKEYDRVLKCTEKNMWLDDLKEFEKQYI